MATNPYSYGSLGQRWTVGEPTSKSLLDISRVKADANRWTLEQLIPDPDTTQTLGFDLSFNSSDQRLLQIYNTDASNYFQIFGGRAASPTSDHLVFSTGTNGTIMEVDGANHWITFHDTAGLQKMYYRGDGSPGLILESGVYLNVGGDLTVANDALFVDASADRVGINSATPGAALDVAHSGTSAAFRVYNSQATNPFGVLIDNTAANLSDANYVADFRVGGYSILKLNNSGQMTFAPNSYGGGSAGNLTVKTGSINSDSIRLEAGGTTSTWLESRGYLGHSWYVDATRSMTLDSTGLGVGTDSPTRLLHLSSTGGTFARFTSENTDDFSVGANANGFVVYNETDADYPFVITNTGNVGISTVSPKGLIDIDSTGRNAVADLGDADDYALVIRNPTSTGQGNGICFTNDDAVHVGGAIVHIDQGSNNTGDLAFYTRDTGGSVNEAMRIDNSQRVGISTSSPLSGLHISDGVAYGSPQNASRKATLTISAGTEASADLQFLNANYNHIFFGDSADANVGALLYDHTNNSMQFAVNGSERARILSSGGITFNGDTAAANALDDYEEGTWTPTINGTTTNPTVGYSNQYGRYTKIGNIVTVQIKIDTSSISGGSGNIVIANLPFTSPSDANYRSAGITSFTRSITNGGGAITLNLGQNDTRVGLYKYTDADDFDTNIPISDFTDGTVTIHGTITYEAQ